MSRSPTPTRIALVVAVCFWGWSGIATCFAQQRLDLETLTTLSESDPSPANEQVSPASEQAFDLIDSEVSLAACQQCQPNDNDYRWLNNVRVGYDRGFVIASKRDLRLGADHFPFRLQLNGWGQLRHTYLDSQGPNQDVNQFQLKRARIVFAGSAFTEDFEYFVQLDGRSSSGDDVRLLDYYLTYDLGHHAMGLDRDVFGFMTGKYKMPFTMARYLSGREFEFTDRSMSSMYFDVNRSLAWGLFGVTQCFRVPWSWELAIFNGLVTGGAETGSSGSLDENFAYSARIFSTLIGDWGDGELADFDWHDRLAMKVGAAFASSTIGSTGTTEFDSVRVVDSGRRLSTLLPNDVDQYTVALAAVDTSWKWRGWSGTFEYYFRTIEDFVGASVPSLYDHGFWLQLGKFVIPDKLQLLSRWSRVVGDSGTLGVINQSSDEIAGGFAWYFRRQHSKAVFDFTHLNGAPINSSSLNITPGERGWLLRTQIQFSF